MCEVGLDAETCREDEVCHPMHDKSRNGLCQCKPGTVRLEADRGCTSTRISVRVDNKTVVLPLANVSLTVELEDSGGQYKYQWTSLSLPASSQGVTVEEGAATPTLSLSHLVEGVYLWRVAVTGGGDQGGSEVLPLYLPLLETASSAEADGTTPWSLSAGPGEGSEMDDDTLNAWNRGEWM